MYATLIFIFFINLASGTIYEPSWRNDSLNKFLDKIILNVKNNDGELPFEAFPLENATGQVDDKSWVHKLFTNFTLYNGTLYNLTTVDRYGDSFISYKENILGFDLKITFKRIEIVYNFEAQGYYNWLSQKALVRASIDDINTVAKINVDMKTYEMNVDGNFIHPGPMSVKLEGSSFSTWVINAVLKIGTTWFEDKILNAIRETVMKIINKS